MCCLTLTCPHDRRDASLECVGQGAPAKRLAGASGGEDGGCPVLAADGNLKGNEDHVVKAGEAKTIMVSALRNVPLIKKAFFVNTIS